MERHVKLQVSIGDEACSQTSGRSGSVVWKNPSGELTQQGFAGTTFFYLSTKSDAQAPPTLAIDVQDRYLFFLWNGCQSFEWQPARMTTLLPISAFAFQGTVLDRGISNLHFAGGAANIQCFGFAKQDALLLAEEFDDLVPLVSSLSADPESPPRFTAVRFMPPKAHGYVDELRKTNKHGFALHVQIQHVLYELIKLYVTGLRTLTVRRSVLDDSGLYEKAVMLIQNRFASPMFTVDALAQALGLSRSNLYRLFEGQGQPSPHRHILMARLDKAKELMEDHSLAIGEIMAIVGFNNAAHFTLQYKIRFGVTPSEDR